MPYIYMHSIYLPELQGALRQRTATPVEVRWPLGRASRGQQKWGRGRTKVSYGRERRRSSGREPVRLQVKRQPEGSLHLRHASRGHRSCEIRTVGVRVKETGRVQRANPSPGPTEQTE